MHCSLNSSRIPPKMRENKKKKKKKERKERKRSFSKTQTQLKCYPNQHLQFSTHVLLSQQSHFMSFQIKPKPKPKKVTNTATGPHKKPQLHSSPYKATNQSTVHTTHKSIKSHNSQTQHTTIHKKCRGQRAKGRAIQQRQKNTYMNLREEINFSDLPDSCVTVIKDLRSSSSSSNTGSDLRKRTVAASQQ